MPDFSREDRMHDTVLDVDVQRLAAIYAKAGLNAAGDSTGQATLIEELQSLVFDLLDKHPPLEEVFRSELISEDEKMALLDRIFGDQASVITLHMLKVMTRHGRLGMIRSVVQAAYQLWEERSGKVYVELEVPAPVSADLQQEILAALKRVLGADPQITTRINPELIAGFVARAGDRVYDASARTSLEKSRHAMLERAVEAIQHRPEQFIDNSGANL